MKKNIFAATALSLILLLSACSSAPAGNNWKEEERNTVENGEAYLYIDENRETPIEENSMLTFSLKVDTAAYTNVERYLENGELPPKDAVRTEELLNYFSYEEPMPTGGDAPFSLYTEVAPSPFAAGKYLALVRVKTPEVEKEDLPPSNLVFLIDTSGSMESYDKLPLLRQAFAMLTENLNSRDRVSIVTYAGSSGVVLSGEPGDNRAEILTAINGLNAEGSTAGAQGLEIAYRLAEEHLISGGNNRVILATDGDFNVGPSSNEELSRLIQEKRDSGVYLSILGFGTGNIRDDLMETLSKDGNGNYAYINSLYTAQKVLVEELSSTLFTVGDDVKAQVEFNPDNVDSYRLIGYENRALENRDFADDSKDAGEIGVGTDVVALFELSLSSGAGAPDGKKYGKAGKERAKTERYGDELMEVRIRYKEPGTDNSRLVTEPVTLEELGEKGSADLQFAGAVAQFGELLRGSRYCTVTRAADIGGVAEKNLGRDAGGYRKNFLRLLKQYDYLAQ